MRLRPTAWLLAVSVIGAPPWAAPAHAQASAPFEVVTRREPERPSHRTAWITGLAGAALVGLSFPLAEEADRRYDRYLLETDVARIDERFRDTERMDRLASGALLSGEALIAAAVWLRFVHRPRLERRVTFAVRPSRCALSLRF